MNYFKVRLLYHAGEVVCWVMNRGVPGLYPAYNWLMSTSAKLDTENCWWETDKD